MSSIGYYVARRVIQAVPLLFGIILLMFLIIHIAPGDPSYFLAGETANIEQVELIRRQYGLDKPLHVQLFTYLSKVAIGDLGYSFSFSQPVVEVIGEKVIITLLLMLSAIAFSSILGIFLGVISSKKPYSLVDNVTSILAVMGYSIPMFWSSMLLLMFFSFYLHIFPTGGIVTLGANLTGVDHVLDVLRHLILPAVALGSVHLAVIERLTRGSMQEVLTQDFIVTAQAKGCDENRVIYRHALRNALLPVVTMIGINFGVIFAGALFVETVFGWPGSGWLMYQAINNRDYPLLMGLFIIISLMVIVANLITDVVYAVIDPRIRLK